MTHDPAPPPGVPGEPGERRLARPPSDRYAPGPAIDPAPDVPAASAASAGGIVRAVVLGDLAALIGAAATVILGGLLAVSAGLLVVAAAMGWAIGQVVVVGGGTSIPRRTRPWLAASSAVLGVVVGQVGLWLVAASEGGVLSIADYLGQTFGPLVPAQAILAVVLAWWTAR